MSCHSKENQGFIVILSQFFQNMAEVQVANREK
jgi:hypothetical protein